jgi:hypothetical protein
MKLLNAFIVFIIQYRINKKKKEEKNEVLF